MQTANDYHISEIEIEDSDTLKEIQQDLEKPNELIAYEHDKERNVVKCVLDLSDFKIDLGYIH